MAKLHIGTSGYDYLDWKDIFYPHDIKRKDFLHYYSQYFSTLELNFSYYKMPTRDQLASMVERSEKKISMSIKAHESMTHKIDPNSWREAVREFSHALGPLVSTEKLAAVLLQFPYSFHYTPENRQYLDLLTREMHEFPLVVEFRNSEWINKRVMDALKERNAGFCSVDAPRLKGLPSPVDIVTSDVGYIRFHGRNEKSWWGSDAAARFDYTYSADELRPWTDRIISMMKNARKVLVYFNNHRRGQAPTDAMTLKGLLSSQGIAEGEQE